MRIRFPRLRTLKWIGFSCVLLMTGLWGFLWNYDVKYCHHRYGCFTHDVIIYYVWVNESLASGFPVPIASNFWEIQSAPRGPMSFSVSPDYEAGSNGGMIRLPMWLPWLATALPTGLLFVVTRKRIPKRNCKKCGYNLAGNMSRTCPECGERADYRPSVLAPVRRALRYCRIVLPVLIAGAAIFACAFSHPSARPQIVVAVRAYDGVQLFKPLGQRQPSRHKAHYSSTPLGGPSYKWDGKHVYGSDECPLCWKPGAKPGAFVFARIPTGIAYATYESAEPGHAHLSAPKPVTPTYVLISGMSLAALIAFGPFLVRLLIKSCARMIPRSKTPVSVLESPVNSPKNLDP